MSCQLHRETGHYWSIVFPFFGDYFSLLDNFLEIIANAEASLLFLNAPRHFRVVTIRREIASLRPQLRGANRALFIISAQIWGSGASGNP